MYYQMGSFGILNSDDIEDEPFILLDGGIERRCQETYDFDNRKRNHYGGFLFQYTLKGKGFFERGGCLYEVGENHGFLVTIPDESRYFLPENASEPWEFIYLHFDGEAALPFVRKIDSLGSGPFSVAASSTSILSALHLHKRLMEGGRLMPLEGGEFICHFLCSLTRDLISPRGINSHSLAGCAMDIMETEYQTLESIDVLAFRLGVSPAHLSRTFKSETGISPVRFLIRRRIQAAIFDLLNTEDSLDTIAARNGFSSGNYFCKVFRGHVGETPTEYRCRRRG